MVLASRNEVLPVEIAPVTGKDTASWTVGGPFSPHLDQRICFLKRRCFRLSIVAVGILSDPMRLKGKT
ncbi:hypothetical protein GT037_001006 [Alternaria burnsii]|uniref:Uncharacterized protein n=1 Tax=Alternaria burnsii TaxID=1187904 RepID=A0A8H7EL06_9PLEO|nr:uncharacterized protein GT037_001006 [Alternaria burnsii]KAF7682030.1 hypothetical protein GT037_001006 [Alternaria burnsii]